MSNLIVRIIAQNLAKKGFTSAARDVKKFEASVKAATVKLARMSLVAAGVGAVGLAKFASFDKSVREIGTLLGDITEQDIKTMGDEVEKMSIKFGQSVEKMAKAKYDIISAGFTDAADSAKLLDVAARLAAGGVSDVSKTADVLTSVLNAYGASADEAEHFSDVLFTTVRLGKTTVDQLASSLGTATAIAPQVGVSFEELSAAIATITAGGQNTDLTMTALTATMSSMLKPMPELAAKLKSLGFESGKAAFESLGFAGTLEALTEKMSVADIGAFFPNIRALKAIFPLTGTLADKFKDNVEAMGNVAGATQTAFAKMEKGISFKLGQMRQIGEKVLRRIGALMADLVLSFVNAESATKNLIISVGLLTAAFWLLGGPIAILVAGATLFYQAWDKNVFGVGELIEKAIVWFKTFGDFVGKTSIFAAKALKAVFTFSFDDIGTAWDEMQTGLVESVQTHSTSMEQINKDFAGAYVGTWKDLIPDFASLLGLGDIGVIEEKAAETIEVVKETLIDPLTNMKMESTKTVWDFEVEQLKIAGQATMAHQAKVTQHIANRWTQGFRAIKQGMINVVGQQAAQAVGGIFRKLVGEQKSVFGQLWSAVLQQFLQMIAAMTARWLAFKALTAIGFSPLSLFFARGGVVGSEHRPKVQKAAGGMIASGFDTVPAMLRRGEAVIPAEQTRDNMPAIRQLISGQKTSGTGGGGGGMQVTVNNNISAIDATGVEEFVSSEGFKNSIINAIETGKIKLNVEGKQVQGAF